MHHNKNQNGSNLNCRRNQIGYEYIDIEYFNKKPLIIKISKIVNSKYLEQIENYYNVSK